MTEKLDVYFNNILTGNLIKDTELTFCYNEEYISSDNLQISASMPKSNEPYIGEVVEAFFQGLLPDEGVKKAIARYLQTDERNTFRLLKEIGGDCAGAISIFEQGKTPLECNHPKYKEVDDKEAFEILSNLKKRPLYIGEDDFRVSGAGAQDKLVACIFNNKLNLPLYGTPSTHIIKPNIDGFKDTTYNELFCMKLAQKCGLKAPNCFIKKFNEVPFYVVERYDREVKNNCHLRIHQEDFCQILEVLPQNKYESDGGPSYKDCFELLNKLGVSASSKISFLNLIIFNYLIGNGDAHAKNFSIIYQNNKPELAPCYDLISTAILYDHYPKVTMAMKLNSSKYLMSKVTREKFAMFSDIAGFRKDYILKLVDEMCKKIIANAQDLIEELNADENTKSEVYNHILDIIKKHCVKISK